MTQLACLMAEQIGILRAFILRSDKVSLTPPPSFGRPLAVPLFRKTIENYVFTKQTVKLDGYTFKNCAFVECSLLTEIGNFEIEQCFLGQTAFLFNSNALRTARLCSLLDWDQSPMLKATIYPNGSVTVKG